MNQMGVPNVTDPSAPTTKGAMFLPQGISQWNQSRADARRARFDPVSTRPNLYVSTDQHVHRVLFDGGCSTPGNGSFRAVGVESSSGPNTTVWSAVATREVILAAGALRTPQLLELSGVGANDTLSSNGIQSLISLPGVGNNLQDHMLLHATQAFNNDSYVYSNIMNNATVQEWARNSTSLTALALTHSVHQTETVSYHFHNFLTSLRILLLKLLLNPTTNTLLQD